jgi:hypothetical protein
MLEYNELLEKVRNQLYQEGMDPSDSGLDYTVRRTIQIILHTGDDKKSKKN